MQANRFCFLSSSADQSTRTMRFVYETVFSDNPPIQFTESIRFPENVSFEKLPPPLLSKLRSSLHLMLGVSYWKAFAAHEIDTGEIQLTPEEADFWTTLYTRGMGEFYYQNELDFRDYLQFPSVRSGGRNYYEHTLQNRALIGIGGGKDSIVAAELLRAGGISQSGLQIENHGQRSSTDAVIDALGIPAIKLVRTLDPQLSRLPGAYTGHVPVSAIYALLGVTTALLMDYRWVIVANEQSANEGTARYLGETVNHQWSKSIIFERLFRTYVKNFLSPDVEYFSLLRPYSELSIVSMFVRFPRYFHVFTSCNRNFRMHCSTGSDSGALWCGTCAKCAFAYLVLAAFLDRETVRSIFGKNLLADEALVPLYRELLGLTERKPFDCVGTIDEVKAAFALVLRRGEHDDASGMKLYKNEVLEKGFEPSLAIHRALQWRDDHCIPEMLLRLLPRT
ncbi:MAG: hypothetical protein N2691_03250 [Patescibacteria group bacterium]|nr:hypothetical protein [Patescibacteria group bacterium]